MKKIEIGYRKKKEKKEYEKEERGEERRQKNALNFGSQAFLGEKKREGGEPTSATMGGQALRTS